MVKETPSEAFERLCRSLEKREELVYSAFENEKGMQVFSMYLRVLKVQLVYSRKWEDLAPPSVLFCRVYPNKNEPFYLHLPALLGYLGAKDFRACYFPYIENGERMESCFSCLMEILDDHMQAMEQFCLSSKSDDLIREWLDNGFSKVPDAPAAQSPETLTDMGMVQWVLRMQEASLVSRFTTLGAYKAFLQGDREKAVRGLEKLSKNGLMKYEWALLEFLKSEDSKGFLPMRPECRAGEAHKQAMGGKVDFCGVAICWLCMSVVMCGTIAITNLVLDRGAVYVYGIHWTYGFILGLLPGMLGYFAFRRQIIPLLPGKYRQQRKEMLAMEKPSKGAYAFAKVFFTAVLLGCLFACVALPTMSDRFYDTYGTYYTEDGGERFDYTAVSQVYCISARYNEFGGRVERSSCVLILDDGRQIDLDLCGSVEQQKKLIRELITDLEIQYVDSNRDLPCGDARENV